MSWAHAKDTCAPRKVSSALSPLGVITHVLWSVGRLVDARRSQNEFDLAQCAAMPVAQGSQTQHISPGRTAPCVSRLALTPRCRLGAMPRRRLLRMRVEGLWSTREATRSVLPR